MSTETRLRDSLHEAAELVVVDEELAWQRTWLDVAQHPARRIRRMSLVLAVASVVVIGVLAWQLLARSSPSPKVDSSSATDHERGTVPPTLFDELTAGHRVDPAAWSTAADALAAARGNVSGTFSVAQSGNAPGVTPAWAFAVDTTGEWRYSNGSGTTIYASDGAVVTANADPVAVLVQAAPERTGPAPAVTPAEIVVDEPDLDHLLRPGAWLDSVATVEHPVITFLGTATANGRPIDRFSFSFPDSSTYGADGWQLDLDARTGIVVRVAVDYLPTSGIDRQVLTIAGLANGIAPLHNGSVALPAGAPVSAVVGATVVPSFRTAAGTTIASLLTQIRRQVP